jgi:hypothetical protein
VKTLVLAAILLFVAVVAAGVIAGAGFAMLESGAISPGGAAALGGAAIIALAALWGLIRLKPWAGTGEPVSPGTRKANNLVLASAALGGVLGAAMSIGTIGSDEPFALLSNSPMPPAVVIPAIAVWLLVVPLISWRWHLTVDEHELRSYQFGGLAALYLYAFVAPAWWLAWRGGLAPEPAGVAIYLAVMAVWGIGWFWRRYR